MSSDDQSHESPDEFTVERGGPITDKSCDDNHQYEVTDTITFDVDRWGIEKITEKCQNDSCEMERAYVEPTGDAPVDQDDALEFAYKLYERFYDEPSSIGFGILMVFAPAGESGRERYKFASLFNDAVNLGCQDKESGRRKREPQEVIDHFLNR